MDNQKLVGVVVELYNILCDIAEGGNYMADQRLRALQPHLQDLIREVNQEK